MAAGAQTVLVVEDEASIASFVSLYLKNAGYDVRAVTTGNAALTQVAAETPALIILDLMLPDLDGIEICRRIRKTSDVPILMLTARDEDVDKIIGLEVGADDYLTKPFNPRELVARVKSVLRRSAPERRRDVEEELRHGDLTINAGRREVKVGEDGDPAGAEGVRPALGAARPQGARADARPAARAGLGVHLRRRHADGRRARAAAAPQARRGVADRHRLGRRLQGRARPQPGACCLSNPMLKSLRFRLPALFLAAIALSGLVTSLIAVQLFRDYTREQTLKELRQEARGLAALYAESSVRAIDEDKAAPGFAAAKLEAATGDRLFYVGVSIFPGEDVGLTRVSRADVGADLSRERVVTFEFRPPGQNRTFLAAAHPLRPGVDTGPIFGYLIVAKEKSELRDAWVTLLSRLAIAFLVALVVVGALAVYLSRRITQPVLALSNAADEVSKGRYDVEVPHVPGGGEIGHLADRFREMTARLAEAEELERNFLMSVSHELRTPLTAIRGHVAALREGVVTDPDTVDASLQTVAEEAERLGRLVGDVLDLAKLDAHRFTVLTEEVDMGRLLEHAFSTFAEEARQRGIEYTSEAEAAPVIVSDGDRVLQIISNLLSNAFRWTPDGGRIDLALQTANGVVTVDVADSGPGIGADARERIFRPFWSTDGRGTGLGLPIARELAVALGGRIELQSELGKGSRFRLVLPNRSF